MIRATLLACSILTFLPSIAMKRLCTYTKQSRPVKRLRIENTIQLPPDIQHIIIEHSADNERTLRSGIRNIKAIALTNKSNYLYLSNQYYSDALIEKLHKKFYCSHETVAKNLHTPASTNRLILQYKLYLLYSQQHLMNKRDFSNLFDRLAQQQVNLDFTYNNNGGTPQTLLMKLPDLLNKNLASKLQVFWSKANFNAETSQKKTLLINAVEYPISSSRIRAIMTHKKNNPGCIDINYRNARGDTALLHCIKNRLNNRISQVFVSTIRVLLKHGANPLLTNNNGKTALELAYEIPDLSKLKDRVIEELKEATEKLSCAQ